MTSHKKVLRLDHIPHRSDEYWEIVYKYEIIAHGFGYDLGEKIANNYRDKYNPDEFLIGDQTFMESMNKLQKLINPSD
tara:strand:+ start:2815 stop:3048 length:234 start_codon:yes stop_codon:yes gene_type:complete